MPRLTTPAFEILSAEIKRIAGDNLSLQVQCNIVLRRLEKLRIQDGPPATYEELRDAICDIYPDFDEKILRKAARTNEPGSPVWGLAGAAVVLLAGLAGSVYILNLPYPMIRRPVARVAPIVLLPSYMSMDHNYRQAISLVEQADQLVNQATSAADLELGEQKVQQASKHLDALPVWFLGYEPRFYCSFFSCSWAFTLDEFRAARAEVGRMEAVVFQEKNAQTLLTEGEAAVTEAKQAYQQAQTQEAKTVAIAQWQAGMDKLQQIPPQTLAAEMAQAKLIAYERDFQAVAGTAAGANRSNTMITVAKEFALKASEEGQYAPHSASKWREIVNLWDMAIARLEAVPPDDSGYIEAQQLLAQYQTNLGIIRSRLQAEEESVEALQQAKRDTEDLLAISDSASTGTLASQLQGIVNQLDTVRSGTTAYEEAQTMLESAKAKLNQLQP